MLKHSFFFLVATFSLTALSQEVQIKHYERKLSIDQIILPNEIYQSSSFNVLIPDSIYTAGTVSIKHLSVNGIKCTGNFYFNENTYARVEYISKNKSIEQLLLKVNIKKENLNIKEEVINCRKKKLILTSNNKN